MRVKVSSEVKLIDRGRSPTIDRLRYITKDIMRRGGFFSGSRSIPHIAVGGETLVISHYVPKKIESLRVVLRNTTPRFV